MTRYHLSLLTLKELTYMADDNSRRCKTNDWARGGRPHHITGSFMRWEMIDNVDTLPRIIYLYEMSCLSKTIVSRNDTKLFTQCRYDGLRLIGSWEANTSTTIVIFGNHNNSNKHNTVLYCLKNGYFRTQIQF